MATISTVQGGDLKLDVERISAVFVASAATQPGKSASISNRDVTT